MSFACFHFIIIIMNVQSVARSKLLLQKSKVDNIPWPFAESFTRTSAKGKIMKAGNRNVEKKNGNKTKEKCSLMFPVKVKNWKLNKTQSLLTSHQKYNFSQFIYKTTDLLHQKTVVIFIIQQQDKAIPRRKHTIYRFAIHLSQKDRYSCSRK